MRKKNISWGKIFATHITDERAVSRTYKELWLMSKKITNPMEKMDEKSGPFTKEQNQVASKHMKKKNASPYW